MAKKVTEMDDRGRIVSHKVTRARRGASFDEPVTTQTTSLRNLLDAVSTFRAGR